MATNRVADESRALAEYWDLLRAPVFWGAGVPRGDGRLVLVLPGLFGNDFYLRPLRTWLARIGYQPAVSTISFNAGCSNRLVGQVEQAFASRLQHHRGDVAIIGHSRGGMLGKALLSRLGPRCTHFIALGSPVGAILRGGSAGLVALAGALSKSQPDQTDSIRTDPRNPSIVSSPVATAGRRAMAVLDPECESPFCNCDYIGGLLAPIPSGTKVTSVYSTEDPIVSPGASHIAGAKNVEVTGTHGGLVYNRAVYGHIAAALR